MGWTSFRWDGLWLSRVVPLELGLEFWQPTWPVVHLEGHLPELGTGIWQQGRVGRLRIGWADSEWVGSLPGNRGACVACSSLGTSVKAGNKIP